MEQEELYMCIGICTPDPDSGYCLGCGRPPLGSPEVVAEIAAQAPPQAANPDLAAADPDTP